MKKCAIITNGYFLGESTLHQLNSLTRELKALDITADEVKGNDALAYIDGEDAKSTFPRYDFAVYLNKDIHTAKMLESTGLRLFNSARAIELCDDKMLTYISLAGKGVNMPYTISSPLMYRLPQKDDFAKIVEEKIGYPVVVKEVYGSMGSGVHLARNFEELSSLREKLRLVPHLYQKFIGKGGEDKRVIVIGGKIIAAMKRVNENDFRSNIAQGGKGFKIDLSEEEAEMAVKVNKALGLDYCGVDILTGTDGKAYFCEANSNAFFKGIEETTGVNVAAAYAKHIESEVYGNRRTGSD